MFGWLRRRKKQQPQVRVVQLSEEEKRIIRVVWTYPLVTRCFCYALLAAHEEGGDDRVMELHQLIADWAQKQADRLRRRMEIGEE